MARYGKRGRKYRPAAYGVADALMAALEGPGEYVQAELDPSNQTGVKECSDLKQNHDDRIAWFRVVLTNGTAFRVKVMEVHETKGVVNAI